MRSSVDDPINPFEENEKARERIQRRQEREDDEANDRFLESQAEAQRMRVESETDELEEQLESEAEERSNHCTVQQIRDRWAEEFPDLDPNDPVIKDLVDVERFSRAVAVEDAGAGEKAGNITAAFKRESLYWPNFRTAGEQRREQLQGYKDGHGKNPFYRRQEDLARVHAEAERAEASEIMEHNRQFRLPKPGDIAGIRQRLADRFPEVLQDQRRFKLAADRVSELLSKGVENSAELYERVVEQADHEIDLIEAHEFRQRIKNG